MPVDDHRAGGHGGDGPRPGARHVVVADDQAGCRQPDRDPTPPDRLTLAPKDAGGVIGALGAMVLDPVLNRLVHHGQERHAADGGRRFVPANHVGAPRLRFQPRGRQARQQHHEGQP